MTTATISAPGDRRMTLTSTGTLPRRAASSVPRRSNTPSPSGARQRRACGKTLSMWMTTPRHSGWRSACKFSSFPFIDGVILCTFLPSDSLEGAAATWVTITSPSAPKCTTTTACCPGTRSAASTWTSTRCRHAAPATSWATATSTPRSRSRTRARPTGPQHSTPRPLHPTTSTPLSSQAASLTSGQVQAPAPSRAHSAFLRGILLRPLRLDRPRPLHSWPRTPSLVRALVRDNHLTLITSYQTLIPRRNSRPLWTRLEMTSRISILRETVRDQSVGWGTDVMFRAS